jgi:hypothetical protein
MRVFAHRERPHPGAQLTPFEAADGWRYSLWVTNRRAATRGWLGQHAYIDAAHRVHARVEDAIRTGKDTGLGHFPSHDFAVNAAWLTAAMTGQILLAWLKLLALDGDLARAEPRTLRYRVLHAAARLVRGGRKRRLKIQAAWPWAEAITIAWQRVNALSQAPDQRQTVPAIQERQTPGPWNPGHPARQPGRRHTPTLKSTPETRPRTASASHQPW